MANMVWGVENKIQSQTGKGVNGFEAATQMASYLLEKAPPVIPAGPPVDTGAKIKYLLGSTVPENWIPFIPVHNSLASREVQLQRGAMPQLIPGASNPVVQPRTDLLNYQDANGKYFIHEEEVPRAGAEVSRTYQRTRWKNGSIHVWLGRRKRTGRGEGASGLRFDQIEENKTE